MACRTFLMDDGSLVFVCGEGLEDAPVCRKCGHMAVNLCDFPIGGDKTCDASLCERHSMTVMKDTHYCPAHAEEYGLLKPVTKPGYRLPSVNDNEPYSGGPPPKSRKRLPKKAA